LLSEGLELGAPAAESDNLSVPAHRATLSCRAIALHSAVHEDDVGLMGIATLYREHRINPFPSTKEMTY
jgi:hypothetical protein